MNQPKLSVIIIAKNEEKNIKDCLDSVFWADEIILVDDESTDHTVEIASQYPQVKIFQRKMVDGFGPQKNFALAQARGEWVLSIDADERITSELKNEILKVINTSEYDGYALARKNLVFGEFWHDGKARAIRLFRRKSGHFTDARVHEHVEVKGKIGELRSPLLHFSRALGKIEDYISVYLNDYTNKMAYDLKLKGTKITSCNSFYYLVIKPILIFIRQYLFKRYFSRGLRGLILAEFVAMAYLIGYFKLWEEQKSK